MGCCGDDDAAGKSYAKDGGDKDLSNGPAKNRGCTDIICLLIFLAHYGAFIFVTFLGVSDGNPEKLIKYRDFKGNYCGIKDQWNKGPNLEAQGQLIFMMNVSSAAETSFFETICSQVVEDELRKVWSSGGKQMKDYRCACCKDPCGICTKPKPMADVSNPVGLANLISNKMKDLQDTASGSIFSTDGPNGDAFSNVFNEFQHYFVPVCTDTCKRSDPPILGNRTFTYSPMPDQSVYEPWYALTTSSKVDSRVRNLLTTSFTFSALEETYCPYDARYCVPFPGVEFESQWNGFCMFKLSADALSKVGEAAGEALASLGLDKIGESVSESFGTMTGDFIDTLDAFVLVAVSSFVIGVIFLVLLRFLVGCVVWTSLFIVLLLFLAAGALCYLRHTQCNGADLFDTGKTVVTAVAFAGQHHLEGGSDASEKMTGNGADYRGVQYRTRDGAVCQKWEDQNPHQHGYTNASYPQDGLESNYCRNPGGSGASIWCFTEKQSQRWGLCTPIGVIAAECVDGYRVESKDMRKLLEILAYVLWGFAALFIIFTMCFCKQICLAIAINKTAATFVAQNVTVLFVPMCQVVLGILWCLAWVVSAAFLLSQVPDGHVTTDPIATYAEAYGTDDKSGTCTGPFINGYVWKYAGNPLVEDDPCSGNKGDISGISPKCWACYPPRYVIDWRVAVSFFSFLWTNAFMIALGQLIIAYAVAIWFFTPVDKKNKTGSVRAGVGGSLRYHTGSVAFGSFVVALVQFIRYTLMYFEKQALAAKNAAMACVLRVLQCCLYCFEKCIKFLNKNAYIQIALHGKGFCTSAKAAFMLILRNMARFGAVAFLGGIIHNIGFIFIIAATAVAGYFILLGLHSDVTPVVPLIVYIAMAYLVAKLYMNVFGLAVDTVLQAFIATEELGGGNWVPSNLAGYFDKVKAASNGDKPSEPGPRPGSEDSV